MKPSAISAVRLSIPLLSWIEKSFLVLRVVTVWGSLLVFSAPLTHSQQNNPAKETHEISPRLQRLATELHNGHPEALSAFWTELESAHTPLVEPVPADSDHVWVTFVYKGSAATRNAIVETLGPTQLRHKQYFPRAIMTRLGTSNVWYRTYRLPKDIRMLYAFGENVPLDAAQQLALQDVPNVQQGLMLDPFNPNKWEGGYIGKASTLDLSKPDKLWTKKVATVAAGHLEKFSISSNVLQNKRDMWTYVPAGYSASAKPYPLIVCLDGDDFVSDHMAVPVVLDNLVSAGKIPPVVAVFVGDAPGGGLERRRDFVFSSGFTEFMQTEVVPWLRARLNVSSKPEDAIIVGASLGGNAAAWQAFQLPEVFGGAISFSGGYMHAKLPWVDIFSSGPTEDELMAFDLPEFEWFSHQVASSLKRPVRFHLEVGTLDDLEAPTRVPLAYPTVLHSTRHFRDVLVAKGYEVQYNEFNGLHHQFAWRELLGPALISMMGPGNKGDH